jgi:hypothetical protein
MIGKREGLNKKGDVSWDTLIPWIIAIVVLVLIVVGSYFFKDQLFGLADKIRGIFRG